MNPAIDCALKIAKAQHLRMERELIIATRLSCAQSIFQNIGVGFEEIGNAAFRLCNAGIKVRNYESEYEDPNSEFYDPWKCKKQQFIMG